uniref:Uncharacterized protein n=1 Tax=Parascaris equorum TaxID=6256 RepID=A0A914RQZ4_PAREQ
MEQLNEHSRTANIIRQRMVIDGSPTSTSVNTYAKYLVDSRINVVRLFRQLPVPNMDKCDPDRREDRKVSFKDAEDMSLKIGFSLFETSAKSGANCELALTEMLEKVYEKHEEAAGYVCDATEEAEPPPRFNLPHIFCQMWNCG